MTAARHARRRAELGRAQVAAAFTGRGSTTVSSRAGVLGQLPPLARGRLLRRSLIVLTVAGFLVAGLVQALDTVRTLGAGSGIAMVTAPVPLTAQVPGSSMRAGVDGVDGLFPGGPSMPVPVRIQNQAEVGFAVHSLAPDPASFPNACPLSAWRVEVPGILPTVAAHDSGTVLVSVAMLPQAPDSCQSVKVRFRMTASGGPA